ncbi:MAG: lycopene beta-cyclase CrtY, partial [Sphingomonadaceae bacterium]
MAETDCDVAILGGGLAGSLIALALARKRPDLSLLLIEASDRIGGDHIWSFFESDIAPHDRWLVAPLVCHSWAAHDVAFPRRRRTIPGAYHAIRSSRLDEVVHATLPPGSVLLGTKVHTAGPTTVLLQNGSKITAQGVIDARGSASLEQHLDLGWQKFVGQELRLEKPHELERPLIMDATIEQIDGYRFLYVLPYTADTLLIEDTYYSDRSHLAPGTITPRIQHYAAGRGWRVAEILHEETGVLPIAMGGNFDAYWRSGGDGVAKAGMRAALFHPTTGYSLPDAVRTASLVARQKDLSGDALHDLLLAHARKAWTERRFFRLLSRMLFRAAHPPQRWKLLDHFYRKDRALIRRFYAARSTLSDKIRLLSG